MLSSEISFCPHPHGHGFPVFTGNDRGWVNGQGCQAGSPDSTTAHPAIPTWKVDHPGIAIPNGVASARTDNVQAGNRIS
jgi:hypothetical protein